MNASPALVLFTATYPFGNKSETFLETEIYVLAERFHQVYVLPSRRDIRVRPLPCNAHLVEMDWLDEPTRSAKQRALVSREATRVLAWTLRPETNIQPYLRAPRMYLDNLARNILKFRSLVRFVQDRRLAEAIFYDYWFENSTLALALLRQSGVIETAVSRAHRFDIYDECWDAGAVPFREAKAGALDAVFAVSNFGAAYLEKRVPSLRGKIRVEHLGVCDPGKVCPESMNATPHVITCGSLLPTKCVHLVPGVLAGLRRPVRWTHFGDGPERPHVIEEALHLDGKVAWELRGHVDNREILQFYKDHRVDAFLSLSVSEGLPVAMMEAQSYGIPIVARGVHGVPEIVNEETGVLLSPDATPSEFGVGLETALDRERFDRYAIRAFFRRHFEASVNYNRFVDALISLREG